MKKILVINQYASTPESGYGGRSFFISESLSKLNKVTLAVGSYHHLLKDYAHQSEDSSYKKNKNFRITSIKLFKYKGARSLLRIINWFSFLFKIALLSKERIGFKPDLIIYSSPPLIGFLGAKFLANRFNCPIFFEVRDIWPLSIIELGGYNKMNPLILFMNSVEKYAYKKSKGIISNLSNISEHISTKTGLKKINFHYSPNGFNKKALNIPNKSYVLKQLDELRKTKKIIGYCGGLALANSLDCFLDTAKIASSRKDLAWVIVGEGEYKSHLKQRKQRESINNVIFLDAVEKDLVNFVLQKMDILFLANKFTNLYSFGMSPMKLPEYLNSGRPIIQIISKESRSLLTESASWNPVNSENPQVILSSILATINMSEDEKSRKSNLAKSYVDENLSYKIISEKLLKFINNS
tara:strand:+ start:2192 stop:3421 length:1230 start_codon:yes stop_codon:yes gene_type:complete